ncbi:MAG: hypothetical protein B7Y41_01955 [Hydrogenophilales bacterium 28-61-23]|nr:MAG: hypothetical protein B7Y41_01955 [Hydrogenophilales bacterium 28-61-23]
MGFLVTVIWNLCSGLYALRPSPVNQAISQQARRSRLMARIRSTDTRPELMLRKALWRAGLRFRLKPRLPGKPDLAFPGARVALFVDGCFWHGCPLHGHLPKSNLGYWKPKLARNLVRDRQVNAAILELGWMPLRIWEHEIALDLPACVARVVEAVQLRSGNL